MRRLVFVLALLGLACASANVMRVDRTLRPPTNSDSVAFFLDEPQRPYTAIALIEVSDEGWGLSLETLRLKLVKEAGKLGGHAVILTRQSTQAEALIPVGRMWFAGDVRKLVGKVIIFTDKP